MYGAEINVLHCTTCTCSCTVQMHYGAGTQRQNRAVAL